MGLRYLIRNIVKRSNILRQNRAASIGEINAKKRNGVRVSLHLPCSMCCSPPFHKGFCSRAPRQQLVLQTPPRPHGLAACFSIAVSDHLSRLQTSPNRGRSSVTVCALAGRVRFGWALGFGLRSLPARAAACHASSACLFFPAWSSTW